MHLQNSEELFIVDEPLFYSKLQHYKWWATFDKSGKIDTIYTHINRNKVLSIGKLILDVETHLDVDHKDRNVLNNCKHNLRTCSFSQNSMNRKKSRGVYSKYKNVYYHKNRKRWHAEVTKESRKFVAPSRLTELEAAKDANRLMTLHHGAFAVLNKLDI